MIALCVIKLLGLCVVPLSDLRVREPVVFLSVWGGSSHAPSSGWNGLTDSFQVSEQETPQRNIVRPKEMKLFESYSPVRNE